MNYKLGITQWCLPGNYDFTLKIAKELGFDAVQLEFGSYDKGMALSHKRLCDLYIKESKELGIELVPIAVNVLCQYGVVDGFDTEKGKIAKDTIKAAVEAAAYLGTKGITMPSFGAGVIKNEAHYENTVEALKFACEEAKNTDVLVYTENVLDAKGMTKLFADCGKDNLRLLFDSQNYSVFGHDYAVDVLKTHFDKLGNHLHVKDGKEKMGVMLLGTGSSPFNEVMEVLKEKNYSGAIIIENGYSSFPLCAAGKDVFELVEKDIETIRNFMK